VKAAATLGSNDVGGLQALATPSAKTGTRRRALRRRRDYPFSANLHAFLFVDFGRLDDWVVNGVYGFQSCQSSPTPLFRALINCVSNYLQDFGLLKYGEIRIKRANRGERKRVQICTHHIAMWFSRIGSPNFIVAPAMQTQVISAKRRGRATSSGQIEGIGTN